MYQKTYCMIDMVASELLKEVRSVDLQSQPQNLAFIPACNSHVFTYIYSQKYTTRKPVRSVKSLLTSYALIADFLRFMPTFFTTFIIPILAATPVVFPFPQLCIPYAFLSPYGRVSRQLVFRDKHEEADNHPDVCCTLQMWTRHSR